MAMPRKKLVRRRRPDLSQHLRFGAQAVFVLLNAWLGIQFFLFVRAFEQGTGVPSVSRPAGVEGWLPIAGLMNLKYSLITGTIPRVHPAAMILLVTFLLISLIFRKAFCSWLCPIGTLSEALWKLGRRLLGRNLAFPAWIDFSLRSLKYLLLVFFLYAIAGLSAEAIRGFLNSPYGLMADVKMLRFFRYLSTTAAVTLLALAVLSVFFRNFWCRYLCPYGALMGLAGLVSPARIRRYPDVCIDCAKCSKACPSLLAVDKVITVGSAECTACFECVAVCPAQGALEMVVLRRRRLPAWVVTLGTAGIFLGAVGLAKLLDVWEGDIPIRIYQQLIPIVQSFSHP